MVLKEQDTTTHTITTERGLHIPGQTNRNEYISEENLEWKRKAYEEDKEHTRAHAQTHTHQIEAAEVLWKISDPQPQAISKGTQPPSPAELRADDRTHYSLRELTRFQWLEENVKGNVLVTSDFNQNALGPLWAVPGAPAS